MTERERWLGAVWPFIRAWLPDAPARVAEIADPAATSEADEQAAIDGGLIQASRIQYAGRRGDR